MAFDYAIPLTVPLADINRVIVWTRMHLQRGRDYEFPSDFDLFNAAIGELPSHILFNHTQDIVAMKLATGLLNLKVHRTID